MLPQWRTTAPLLRDPSLMNARGYQSFIVLSAFVACSTPCSMAPLFSETGESGAVANWINGETVS